jgi:putative nucleotidyltransferase with HDIG domain
VILKLVSHGEYLYYHSIAVSIFTLFIGKATGQFDRETLETIGMGAFLHDIGCTQLPKDVIDCTTVYTPDQRKVMEQHAKLGLQMLLDTGNVPEAVKFIVYQHHEEPGGHGYPNKITGSKLYYPVRVVALADAFSAMISKRPFRPAFTVEQAIKILREKKQKFDPKLVELLASIILPNEKGKKAA